MLSHVPHAVGLNNSRWTLLHHQDTISDDVVVHVHIVVIHISGNVLLQISHGYNQYIVILTRGCGKILNYEIAITLLTKNQKGPKSGHWLMNITYVSLNTTCGHAYHGTLIN